MRFTMLGMIAILGVAAAVALIFIVATRAARGHLLHGPGER